MKAFSADTIWQMSEKELREALDGGLLESKSRIIRFYAPSFMYYKTENYCSKPNKFPTISITSRQCALNCKHCNTMVLESMLPAATPEMLFKLCKKLKENSAEGCLISGGCRTDGSVPLENFIDAIARIKRELGLTVFVHTGTITHSVANALFNAGVDAALIDVICSDETIKEILKANITTKNYDDSLKALEESGVPFVPHIITGLHYGKLKGERNALNLILKYKPSAIVVIAFMPIRSSEMASIKPSAPVDVARVVAATRASFPKTPIVLGCMRPKGAHQKETDVLALKAGADAIAFPTQEAIDYAGKRGHETVFSSFCCSQILSDIKNIVL
jgi:lipoyl synthase